LPFELCPLNLFQIISLVLVLLVIILIVRYVWGIFFDKNYQPVEWENLRKQGLISKELIRLERNYPDKVRFFNWWFQVERLKRDGIPGDFAELGVYKGESAKIIHLMDPSRKFHLYDTFEGFKEEDLKHETGIAATYTTRNFADTSLEAVRRNLGDSDRFVYHQGRFPEFAGDSSQFPVPSSRSINDLMNCELRTANCELTFSLVNLDADLHQPTKAGLEYFYPLLSPGGIIIIHDYNYKWPGIKKAVDEFVSTIPETLIIVPDMEGSVIIVKSAILPVQLRPQI
jgi:O-methyltransferase